MHQYLRAVGFSNIENKKQVRDLMNDVIINPNRKEFIETGTFDAHVLKEGDEVEFLYFMGGGQ